jgi:hypothetical protein
MIEAFECRGGAWYRKRESEKAIKNLDEAIRLDPNQTRSAPSQGGDCVPHFGRVA